MKVLLFTHSQDIDGAGNNILALQAFDDVNCVPTKTFDINKNVKEYIDNKKIYEYDKIFVTDLCIKEPLLSFIDKDEYLRNHLVVIDHHKTEIEECNDKYDFVNITIDIDGIKQSGTSLFYKYLISNNLIKKTSFLDELVEYTRQYDIWDWVKNNNYEARKLHILFENLGYDEYIKLMLDKVDMDGIKFNEYEKNVIDTFESNLLKVMEDAVKDIKIVNLKVDEDVYNIGYVRCDYKYRNDFNDYIKKLNKYDIDCVGMIMNDTDTVSYRQIKDIDVSGIAKYFDGKGHKEASTNSQNNELFIKFMEDNKIKDIDDYNTFKVHTK